MPESDAVHPKIVWGDDKTEDSFLNLKTPTKQEIKERGLESEIRKKILPKLKENEILSEVLKWYSVAIGSNPRHFSWMLKYEPNYSADQIIEELIPMAGDTKKEARIVYEMHAKLKGSIKDPKKAYIVLKRVREKGGRSWDYRVIAWIPKDTQVDDGICDNLFDLDERGNIVYFRPSSACVEHSYDVLYKASSSENRGVIETQPISLFDCFSKLNRGRKFGDEFQIHSEEGEILQQDPLPYVMTGLLGGYSNEFSRFILTPFLK